MFIPAAAFFSVPVIFLTLTVFIASVLLSLIKQLSSAPATHRPKTEEETLNCTMTVKDTVGTLLDCMILKNIIIQLKSKILDNMDSVLLSIHLHLVLLKRVSVVKN